MARGPVRVSADLLLLNQDHADLWKPPNVAVYGLVLGTATTTSYHLALCEGKSVVTSRHNVNPAVYKLPPHNHPYKWSDLGGWDAGRVGAI